MGKVKYSSANLNDPDYKGEVCDDKLRNGPVQDRHCTDVLCYCFFLAFLAGMVIVAAFGWANGNPKLLLSPFDEAGNACGYDAGYENYKYIYFKDITSTTNLKYTVCVSSCPKATGTIDCMPNAYEPNCYPTYSFMRYNSTVFAGRYCLPNLDELSDTMSDQYEALLDKVGGDKLAKYVADIANSWPVILIVCGVAFVIGALYMILLKWTAGLLAWLSILLVLGALGGGGAYCYKTADKYNSAETTHTNLQISAYVLWGCCGLFFLFILCMYSRIKLAIAIIKASAGFVKSTPTIFLVPLIFFLVTVAFFAIWVVASIYIWSVGTITKSGTTVFADVEWNDKTRYAWIYHLFGLLWITEFLAACSQFVIASSASIWYFSHSSDASGTGKIRTGFWWILRYHLGSLAFGSCIVAIIEMIQILFEYFRRKMQATKAADNKCMKVVLCMVACCLACLNRFVKFINRNAYIQIALTSDNFCTAAKNGFFLIMRNPFRFGAVQALASAFIFLGKLVVGVCSALIGYVILENWTEMKEKIYSPIFPTIVFFFAAYCIGYIFMSLYGMASNTILQAFLVDEEISEKHGGGRGQHRPPELDDFITKHHLKT